MVQNEFQFVAHRNQHEMLDAIAGEWLTAGGANSEADVQQVLRDTTDADLAAECIEGWGLDVADDFCDDEAQSHMASQGYDVADLAAAFARARLMPRVSVGADLDA